MGWVTSAVSAPLLLVCTLPLATFAIVTTTLAFWVLFFRVSIIYVEVFATLLRAYITPPQTKTTVSPPIASPISSPHSPRSRRTSRRSSSGSIHAPNRLSPKSQSTATLVFGTPERDYEGVGGWRLQENHDEEALWMSINSRLELPAEQTRRQRSLTSSSSQVHSGFASPDLTRSTPLALRTPGVGREMQGSGAAGPPSDEYFGMPLSLVTDLDYGSGVSLRKHTRKGSSSTTSSGSVISPKHL